MHLGPIGSGIAPDTTDPTDPNKVDVRNKPVDVTVSPKEFKADSKDEKMAAEKYGDRVIQTEGEVHLFIRNANGDMVYLKAEGDVLGLGCYTTEREPWTKLAPGQRVKIKGWSAKRYASHGILYSCVVVEASDNPALRISAAELAKEYAADRKATDEKYDNKPLYTEGEIVSKGKDGDVFLRLKGVPGVEVNCAFSNDDAIELLKPGETVRLLGEFKQGFNSEKYIGLSSCHLITK
jgi:hypothetical protein